jgi:hypothetical protein
MRRNTCRRHPSDLALTSQVIRRQAVTLRFD